MDEWDRNKELSLREACSKVLKTISKSREYEADINAVFKRKEDEYIKYVLQRERDLKVQFEDELKNTNLYKSVAAKNPNLVQKNVLARSVVDDLDITLGRLLACLERQYPKSGVSFEGGWFSSFTINMVVSDKYTKDARVSIELKDEDKFLLLKSISIDKRQTTNLGEVLGIISGLTKECKPMSFTEDIALKKAKSKE